MSWNERCREARYVLTVFLPGSEYGFEFAFKYQAERKIKELLAGQGPVRFELVRTR